MAYSPPSIGTSGLTIPQYPDILSFLIAQYQGIYGSGVYLGADSPDYQDMAVRALQASDVDQFLQAVWLSFNPQTAIGSSLDLLGKLIGTARRKASYSSATVVLTGTPSAVVIGGVAQDSNGNFWNVSSPVVIGGGGTASAIATAQQLGAVVALAGTITIITTPTQGWTAITNPASATTGVAVEPDSSYRARLLVAQTLPSLSLRAGTAAAVSQVSSVTRSVVYENPYGYTASYGLCSTSGTAVTILIGYPVDASVALNGITINGVQYVINSVSGPASLTLSSSAGSQTSVPFYIGDNTALGPPHSISAVVEGGSGANITQAIYDNKNPGVLTNGAASVFVVDPSNSGISMPIAYSVLGYLQIYVGLSVHGLTGYTSATTNAIQEAVLTYLDSLGIGQPVVYSELYGAALAARPNPDQPLFSIRSVTSGYLTAQTSATTTIGNASITVSSATGISTTETAVGTGIPANTTVSSVVGGQPSMLTVHAGGTGYTTASALATTGGTGTGLTVNIVASGGAITSVTVAVSGSGYTVGDVVTVTQSGGSGGTLNVTVTVGTIGLSANATASGTITAAFFKTATSDIPVAWNQAAQSAQSYVVVTTV